MQTRSLQIFALLMTVWTLEFHPCQNVPNVQYDKLRMLALQPEKKTISLGLDLISTRQIPFVLMLKITNRFAKISILEESELNT